MAIALNQARGLRRDRRDQATSSLVSDVRGAERAEDANRDLREAALRAIAGLPDRQREAMLLFLNTDRTLNEIGDALGCSKGAVGAHLHRARATLRKVLGRWARPTP